MAEGQPRTEPSRRSRVATIFLVLVVGVVSFTCGRLAVAWQGVAGQRSSCIEVVLPDTAGGHSTINSSYRSSSPAVHTRQVQLFVGVVSACSNREKRDAVRQTWTQHPALVRVVFVVSKPRTPEMLQRIRQEAAAENDIVFVGHIDEHYHNLTYQSLEIFRAAVMWSGPVTHVLKCDDDSYIHVDRLVQFLELHPLNHTWAGSIDTSFHPIRDPSSKWFVSKAEWPEDRSDIKWSHGPGYVITADLVRLMVAGGVVACAPGPLFKLEDVAVGSWLSCLEKEQNITIHLARGPGFNIDGCAVNDLVSHYRTPAEMRCMYSYGGQCC